MKLNSRQNSVMNSVVTELDGTPSEGKLSCSVWCGGKSEDDVKGLPIAIMMKKVKILLKSKKGNGAPIIVAIILVFIFIFYGISQYLRLLIIAEGVRNSLQSAVVATAIENYDDVYHGVREGYSGGYFPSGNDFEESLDYGDIYDRLDSELGLKNQNGYHVKQTYDKKTEYKLLGLNVDIVNTPFGGNSNSNQFKAKCSIMLEVPISYGEQLLPPMRIKVRTDAGYIPKF